MMCSLLLESRIEIAHRQNVWATRVDSFCNQNFNQDFVKGNIRRFSTIRVNQVKQSPDQCKRFHYFQSLLIAFRVISFTHEVLAKKKYTL